MSEKTSMNQAGMQWFELANDIYSTYVKNLIKGQERLLELSKSMVSQASNYQAEGKTLLEEYANQVQRAQQLMQQVVQQNMDSSMELINQYRTTANSTLADMNKRLDDLQVKLEGKSK